VISVIAFGVQELDKLYVSDDFFLQSGINITIGKKSPLKNLFRSAYILLYSSYNFWISYFSYTEPIGSE
jgi:hypothetical protein